jgi:type I restriction enzyme S subunit
LGEVGAWGGGSTPSTSNEEFWEKGTVPWVTPKDMKRTHISDSIDKLNAMVTETGKLSLYLPGSVLMVTRSGILKHSFPVAILNVSATVNQDIKVLIPSSIASSNWLFFATRAFENQILETCSKVGATVDSIDTDKLMNFFIPIPSREEQERILCCIQRGFASLDSSRRLVAEISCIVPNAKASLLASAFSGRLVPQDLAEGTGHELLAQILNEKQSAATAKETKKTKAAKAPRK